MEYTNSRRGGNYCHEKCCVLVYAMCVTLFSTALFLYGFFPLKLQDDGIATMEDVPNHVEHIRVNNDLYKPLKQKLVIMVIDGLRWDFVAGPIGHSAMPITRKLIENNTACLLRARAGSPTVTMPRIKAMTTGTAPLFVDVVLNFGSKSISGDSLLLQAKNNGHKLIFYGDDTWLKLFPDIFERFDGTTSFFVTDYTEVDNNVTRHLNKELNNKDWSIMVLHYLGLDHIGHISGPQSPLIKPKLREMDEIVGKIQAKAADWHSEGEPTLFVVCGDHGMRDSGGHGGNTPEETLVPFITIGTSCPRNDNEPIEISQIDMSSTLAILLGIPIPASNLGRISLHILRELSPSRKLFSLYYNAKQIFKHFKKLSGFQVTGAYKKYVNAVKLHLAWLETSGATTETVDEITDLYDSALRGMRDKLTSGMTKYDLRVMIVAIFLMYHALYIMTITQRSKKPVPKKIAYFIAINGILWILIDYVMGGGATETLLLHNHANSNLLLVIITVIISANSYLFARLQLSVEYVKEQLKKSSGTMRCLLLSGTVIHALSFISSSFVEEEHRTWYFFWTTFCVLLIYHIVKSIVTRSPRFGNYIPLTIIPCGLFLSLLAHALLLRNLNSTGDMYAHLPDIADWLQQDESKIYISILLVFALALLVWIGYIHEKIEYKRSAMMLHVPMATCVYLRHMATEAVARIPFYPRSRGIYEVHIFWCLMIIFISLAALRLGLTMKRNRRNFLSLLIRFILELWVMVSAILHRPYNVVLLPVQLLFSIIINAALKGNERRETLIHIYYWLGNVFYFYQGNSNNLSTIDVAAGYVGMEAYNPLTTGLFLIVNTYSAPVLAYLTLLYFVISRSKNSKSLDDVLEINRRYAIHRLLPLAVYAIVVSIQRYHLFVWTVFSPKLLYEAMYCGVMYSTMFFMNFNSFCHDKINQY